jgi:hypothetical protein
MDATNTIQHVIDSNYRLAALETGESDRLVALFKRIALTTGRAVYHWLPASGLYRLGVDHILIPRTQAPADVLAYILHSRHYGIYLLQHFDEALAKNSVQRTLLEIGELDDSIRRLVIMVGDNLEMPTPELKRRTATIRHNVRPREHSEIT